MVSETIDAPYASGNRSLWRKSKWLNRQKFIIVGWSDSGRNAAASRRAAVGPTPMTASSSTLAAWALGCPTGFLPIRLEPLARKTSPLSALRRLVTRFGSPLVLSRVEPKLVTSDRPQTSKTDQDHPSETYGPPRLQGVLSRSTADQSASTYPASEGLLPAKMEIRALRSS